MSRPLRSWLVRALLLGTALCTLNSRTAAAGPVTDVGSDARRMLGEDLPAYAAAPASWKAAGWVRLGVGGAMVGLVALGDDAVRAAVADRNTSFTRRVAGAVRSLGDVFGLGGLSAAAVYGTGVLTGSERWRGLGFEMLEAAAFASLTVAPLKVAVGRSRPGQGEGPWSFRWLRGGVGGAHSSFPSHHAALAFSLAGVVSARVDGAVWWAWSLAGLVAASRVHDEAHWASDVVAGALVGAAVGRWVAGRRDRSRFSWMLWTGRGRVGAVCRVAF